jgi:hypothetical protein
MGLIPVNMPRRWRIARHYLARRDAHRKDFTLSGLFKELKDGTAFARLERFRGERFKTLSSGLETSNLDDFAAW